MKDEHRDPEGYPVDPEARAQEERVEQMLGQLPRVQAPRSLRAEVMAELRSTPPGMATRLRRWWAGLGGWRVPIQLAPVAVLAAAVFMIHSMVDLRSDGRPQASGTPSAPDGGQIATASEQPGRAELGTPPSALQPQSEPIAIKPASPRRDVSALAVLTSRTALRSIPTEEMSVREVATAESLAAPEAEQIAEDLPADSAEVQETQSTIAAAPDITVEVPDTEPSLPDAEVHIATPLGAGTREQVTRERPMLPLPEDFRLERERLRSETLIQSIDVAELPEPEELPGDAPRIRINSQRLDPPSAPDLGTAPPEDSAFNETYTGGQVPPPGLAFQSGTTLTPEDFHEARERAALLDQSQRANAGWPPTDLIFTVEDPEAFAGAMRTIVEDYSGRVISAIPVTSDRRTWRVVAEMPRWRIDYLRRELDMLASEEETGQVELPPEPQQLPPAMRRFAEVRVVIESTLPTRSE